MNCTITLTDAQVAKLREMLKIHLDEWICFTKSNQVITKEERTLDYVWKICEARRALDMSTNPEDFVIGYVAPSWDVGLVDCK